MNMLSNAMPRRGFLVSLACAAGAGAIFAAVEKTAKGGRARIASSTPKAAERESRKWTGS